MEKIEEYNTDNGLKIKEADFDGFHICEENGEKIYVYYSELPEIIQALRKIEYHRKTRSNNIAQAQKEETENTLQLYKHNGNIKSFRKYQSYIRSDKWKKKKEERLKKDNYICLNCGSKEKLEIHHKNYNSLYNEDISDLKTLCEKCHKKITEKTRKKKKVITDCS